MSVQGAFTGQVAVVTGAAGGIGEAIASAFRAEGAVVVTVDAKASPGAPAGSDAELSVVGDVSEREVWQRVVRVVRGAGPSRVLLVNNAGIYRRGAVEDVGPEDVDLLYRVNQRAALIATSALRDLLRLGGGGAVVNISSTAGVKGDADTSAYSGTKWAVRGITKALAAELGEDGIRVNTVLPGLIDTAMATANGGAVNARILSNTFLKRIGRPADISPSVLFLCSSAAAYVTGAELVIDGGLSA